jgi:hypothetical protein
MVSHSHNPNYSGAEIGQILVQGQPRLKISETPSPHLN